MIARKYYDRIDDINHPCHIDRSLYHQRAQSYHTLWRTKGFPTHRDPDMSSIALASLNPHTQRTIVKHLPPISHAVPLSSDYIHLHQALPGHHVRDPPLPWASEHCSPRPGCLLTCSLRRSSIRKRSCRSRFLRRGRLNPTLLGGGRLQAGKFKLLTV